MFNKGDQCKPKKFFFLCLAGSRSLVLQYLQLPIPAKNCTSIAKQSIAAHQAFNLSFTLLLCSPLKPLRFVRPSQSLSQPQTPTVSSFNAPNLFKHFEHVQFFTKIYLCLSAPLYESLYQAFSSLIL